MGDGDETFKQGVLIGVLIVVAVILVFLLGVGVGVGIHAPAVPQAPTASAVGSVSR